MATFQSQIQAYTGSGSLINFNHWLEEAAQELINIFPFELKRKCGTFTLLNADNGTTLDMDDVLDILYVTRENADSGYYAQCREIPPVFGDLANDSTEMMHYATAEDPVYWIESNSSDASTLFVKPTPDNNQPSKVYHISKPTITYGSSTIANFPNEAEYLVILGASCKALFGLMEDSWSDLPSDVSEIVLSTTETSLPTYSSPDAFVLPVKPGGVDVDFSEVGSILTYTSPIFTVPTLATINSMSLPNAPVTPTLSSQSVSFSADVPTFTPPVMSLLDYADANTWISTEEDAEMLTARVQEIQIKIGEYSARLQESQAKFQKELNIYQTQFQKSTKDADLSQLDDAEKVQLFQAQIGNYQNDINKEIQRWTSEEYNTKFNEWTQRFQGALQEYATNVQNEQARVQLSFTDYQAKVTKAVQTYQSETGYDMTSYGAELQANLQKFNSDLQKNSTDYMNNLQKYQIEFGKITSDNQSSLARYSQDIANYGAKIQKQGMEYQWLHGQYQGLKAEYNQGVQMLLGANAEPAPPQQQQQQQQERR